MRYRLKKSSALRVRPARLGSVRLVEARCKAAAVLVCAFPLGRGIKFVAYGIFMWCLAVLASLTFLLTS